MTKMTRKNFISTSVVTVGAAGACLCGLNGCAAITRVGDTPPANPESYSIYEGRLKIDLNKEPELQKIGGSVKILDPGLENGLIVACAGENSYIAASIHCTHRQVEVEYDKTKMRFECASLGSSVYGPDGNNISGPAKKPLHSYEADVQNGILIIKV